MEDEQTPDGLATPAEEEAKRRDRDPDAKTSHEADGHSSSSASSSSSQQPVPNPLQRRRFPRVPRFNSTARSRRIKLSPEESERQRLCVLLGKLYLRQGAPDQPEPALSVARIEQARVVESR